MPTFGRRAGNSGNGKTATSERASSVAAGGQLNPHTDNATILDRKWKTMETRRVMVISRDNGNEIRRGLIQSLNYVIRITFAALLCIPLKVAVKKMHTYYSYCCKHLIRL